MSTAQNNIATERADRITVPIGTGVVIKQGDFIAISSKLGVSSAAAQPSPAPIGISDDSNPVSSLGGDNNPNVGGAAAAIEVVLTAPYKGCAIVSLPLANSRTAGFWDAIYFTADAQIVTDSSNSATQCGRCVELVTFTGDGTTRMKVLLCGAN